MPSALPGYICLATNAAVSAFNVTRQVILDLKRTFFRYWFVSSVLHSILAFKTNLSIAKRLRSSTALFDTHIVQTSEECLFAFVNVHEYGSHLTMVCK